MSISLKRECVKESHRSKLTAHPKVWANAPCQEEPEYRTGAVGGGHIKLAEASALSWFCTPQALVISRLLREPAWRKRICWGNGYRYPATQQLYVSLWVQLYSYLLSWSPRRWVKTSQPLWDPPDPRHGWDHSSYLAWQRARLYMNAPKSVPLSEASLWPFDLGRFPQISHHSLWKGIIWTSPTDWRSELYNKQFQLNSSHSLILYF